MAGRQLHDLDHRAGRKRPAGLGADREIEGLVNSVDLTQSPPTLSVNGQNHTLNQITRAVTLKLTSTRT